MTRDEALMPNDYGLDFFIDCKNQKSKKELDKLINKIFDDFEDVLDNLRSRTCKSCKYYQDEDKQSLQGYCDRLKRREDRSHCCNKWDYKR